MTYLEALEQIRATGLTRGIVTGPQRSGTAICAEMLAQDLGFEFLHEQYLAGDDPLDKLRRTLLERDHFVIQAPVWSRWVHELEGDFFVVWMLRSLADILASQKRIHWGEGGQLAFYGADEGPIATIKLDFWREHQRDAIEHAYEIEYESLSVHPLWVPKEKRYQ
jgi:hypothetical protein